MNELEKQLVQHVGDKYAECKAKLNRLRKDRAVAREFYEGRLSVLNELLRVIDRHK